MATGGSQFFENVCLRGYSAKFKNVLIGSKNSEIENSLNYLIGVGGGRSSLIGTLLQSVSCISYDASHRLFYIR